VHEASQLYWHNVGYCWLLKSSTNGNNCVIVNDFLSLTVTYGNMPLVGLQTTSCVSFGTKLLLLLLLLLQMMILLLLLILLLYNQTDTQSKRLTGTRAVFGRITQMRILSYARMMALAISIFPRCRGMMCNYA